HATSLFVIVQSTFMHSFCLGLARRVVSFLFFFSCFGAHRDLHSFPTRRSSDLLCIRLPPLRWGIWRGVEIPEPRQIPSRFQTPRSEEHTSELQSRENLVCRLLLEKKKVKE